MNRALPPLDHSLLEPLARALGEAATGSQLTRLFAHVDLSDPLGHRQTKWKRIYAAMEADQAKYHRANRVLAFAKVALAPARFVNEATRFESLRTDVNQVLAFGGYQIREDGTLVPVAVARTLGEAQERASRLRAELLNRRVHPDVLRFCRAELVVPNYFHAVFEATKSVAEKLRARSGLASDGAELVDGALALGPRRLPMLAFNSLQTSTEQSEHKGLTMLLKGMFGAFRNVTAHAPKITWPIEEQDALDLLTLASFLHRRLDCAVQTNPTPQR